MSQLLLDTLYVETPPSETKIHTICFKWHDTQFKHSLLWRQQIWENEFQHLKQRGECQGEGFILFHHLQSVWDYPKASQRCSILTDTVTNRDSWHKYWEGGGGSYLREGWWPPSTPCWEKPPTVCIRATNFPKITQCNSVKFYNSSINLISRPSCIILWSPSQGQSVDTDRNLMTLVML